MSNKLEHTKPIKKHTIDAKRLLCPMPVIKLQNLMKNLLLAIVMTLYQAIKCSGIFIKMTTIR